MKQSEFSGSVTSGTKMKVSYLSFGDKGTLGKLWRVEFLITSGVHANKLIVPPSPYHLLYPDWLERSREKDGPKFKQEFIRKCKT